MIPRTRDSDVKQSYRAASEFKAVIFVDCGFNLSVGLSREGTVLEGQLPPSEMLQREEQAVRMYSRESEDNMHFYAGNILHKHDVYVSALHRGVMF